MKKSPTATATIPTEPTADTATATIPTEPTADTATEPIPTEPTADTATEPISTEPTADTATEPISTEQPTVADIADRIRAEFHTLSTIAPSLTIDALVRSDGYDALASRIKRGYTLLDAYILSCVGDVTVEFDGRSHLRATALYGKTQPSPPSDVARLYRLYMPKSRIGEIEKNYNEYLGKIKKGRR